VDISPPASGDSITYSQADLDCFRLDCPDGAFDLALTARLLLPIVRTNAAQSGTLWLLIQRKDSSLASDPSGALKVSLLTSHY
jgi:hypothetical protein